jgi:glutamate synthase (NADPH/NADH) small chain
MQRMTIPASDNVVFVEHPEIAGRFAEIHPPFVTAQAAKVEANRCLYCFDAPCMVACPTHIDVPGFIKKIASGNLRGSAHTILEANVLAASCARVCPVDVLCEGACVMNRQNQKPIEIGRLQRFAMDAFLASGEGLPQAAPAVHLGRFAMIGAGPASLACAAELRRHGHEVDVFDKQALPGGLNTYGVAEYKLRTSDSLHEIELIQESGVRFHFNTEITPSALETMEQEYDAVFLGVGLGVMHKLGLPGEDMQGVVNALDFIAEYKTAKRLRVPDSVVVIGAGNTAIDAANAAPPWRGRHFCFFL